MYVMSLTTSPTNEPNHIHQPFSMRKCLSQMTAWMKIQGGC